MDQRFNGFLHSTKGFNFSNDTVLNGDFSFVDHVSASSDVDLANYARSWSPSPERDSNSDDGDFSDTVLKYISHILMEEDTEEKPCMFRDTLALQAAENSFHQALGGTNQPLFPNESSDDNILGISSDYDRSSTMLLDPLGLHATEKAFYQALDGSPPFSTENPDDNISWSHSDNGGNSSSMISTNTRTSVDLLFPGNSVFHSNSEGNVQSELNVVNTFPTNGNRLAGSSFSEILVPNLFSDSESALQFIRGVEEADKFLPKSDQLIIDLDIDTASIKLKEKAPKAVVKVEQDEEYSPNGIRGKKNREREDTVIEEERSNKQSAVFIDENELSEMFDRVLLCAPVDREEVAPLCTTDETLMNGTAKSLQQNGQSNGVKAGVKKQGTTKELVDLRTLLIMCAQAVSADDRRTATETLKQVRQHASPFGDGSQRLAHYFANCLEARLVGTGAQIYTALAPKRTSAADVLKSYQTYMSVCPFNKLAIIFANHMILKLAETAKTLHIIDFGILYGFQWPALIHRLSKRPGGPPKLRITGIELPQHGFRPAERVQETGRRLAKYCERFKVPFEYKAFAQKWETLRIENFKINGKEALAVNCLFRFKNLLDETVVVNSPRNAVLNLIRKLKPDIFVHSIVNGSYSAPFFVTRFREALFHYSALFDMLDTNLPREDEMRLMFEKEFYGREAVNAIACEGSERVERPETYRQWQVRNMRAGFRQLSLDRGLVKKLRGKIEAGYHDDFVLDEDGCWMLQGWKGRIVYASSAWVPM